nr:AsmA family protein [Candidatus Enterousia merdequi]
MFLYTFYKRHILMLRMLALFFMGLLVAFIIALHQINFESLRGNIISTLRDSTNMPIEIDGEISWRFSLQPEIELNEIYIKGADWAKNKNIFTAKKIDVRLDFLSLFKSKPAIRYIRIHDAKVSIEKDEKGNSSVVFNNLQTPEEQPNTEKNDGAIYPVTQFPFSGLEIQNISANIYGKKYSLASFGIHNDIRQKKMEYTGWIKPYDKNLPFIIQFSKYDKERNVYPVHIAFATGGEPLIADINLDGNNKLPTDFMLSGEIPNIKKSGAWLNVNIMKVPKIKLNIVGTFNENAVSFKESTLSVDKSSLVFSGKYDFNTTSPVLHATITSDNIDVYKSFPEWFGAGQEWVHPDRELNVFHDMPLLGKYLYNMDVDLDIKIKHFTVYRSLYLSNMKAEINVHNHKLRIDTNTGFAKGNIKAVIDGEINSKGVYTVNFAAHGEKFNVGEILKEIYYDKIISGLPMNLDLYLKAQGADMSQIMQTITGPVMVYSIDKGFAHSDLVEYMYGGDFLTSLRHNVEDLFTGNKRDMIEIDGAIANLKLRNGLIETQNGVAVETHVVNMRLAGNLDLGKETIDLSLASVPVRGLKLSLSGNLVNVMQISGNLAEPDFKISGAAVVGKVGSAVGIGLLLAPLTGGLSIAGGLVAGLLAGDLLEGWLADDKPYDTAKEKGAPTKRDDPDWMNTPIQDLTKDLLYKK